MTETTSTTKIGKGYAGNPGNPGDPGNQFDCINVTIWRRKNGRFRCKARAQRGEYLPDVDLPLELSDCGHLKIHKDHEVIGRGDALDEAADDAKSLAQEAEMDAPTLAEAMSEGLDKADNFLEEEGAQAQEETQDA